MKIGVDDFIAAGAGLDAITTLPRVEFTPKLSREAFSGLAGRIVGEIEAHSEADPIAILVHLLFGIGNLIGRGAHAMVERAVHACNENAAFVGLTGKSRKGQSWATVKALLRQIDPEWVATRVRSGLSSGEGVIFHVRDAREESQPIKERGKVIDYQNVVVDPGEPDKRLFVIEPELASVLRRMNGQTNSLSAVIRQAWDDGDLSTLTKNNPLRATGAHISIVAHVTREELLATLTETEQANGFANRFLFFQVRRSKVLPEGAPVPEERLAPLIEELRRVVGFAREPMELRRDDAAREVWAGVYPRLSEGEPGLLGAVLARAEAHVLRLSMLYALLDRSRLIRPKHLLAALALWEYADASAKAIFGSRLGLSVADTIHEALRARGPMTRTDIAAMFHRNKPASEIDAALCCLDESGRARREPRPSPDGRGRPAEVWAAT